jgi:hypothetical protein
MPRHDAMTPHDALPRFVSTRGHSIAGPPPNTTVSPTLSARSGVMGRVVLMLMVTGGATREPARNGAGEREADCDKGVVEVTLRPRR